jgi:hypothetical protein
MGRASGTKGEKRIACKILSGMPEGNKTIRRPSRRWAVNIKMELQRLDGVVCIGLMWLRLLTGEKLL